MPPTEPNEQDSILTRSSRQAVLVALLAVVTAAFLLWTGSDLCVIKNTTGIPCPGCGLTRATLAMMTGDWPAVWTFHPLAPIVTPLAVGFMGWVLFRALRRDTNLFTLPRFLPTPLLWLLGVLMVTLYIGRLMGYFGGHPDAIDPWGSQPGRLLLWLMDRAGSAT